MKVAAPVFFARLEIRELTQTETSGLATYLSTPKLKEKELLNRCVVNLE